MEEQRTLKNLMEGYARECQAIRKYLAYAKKAEAEGKGNVARLFRATAEAEAIHAQKELELAGKILSTEENLSDAEAGETNTFKNIYPEFLKTAREEENKEAAKFFAFAMQAEGIHAKRYKEALDSLNEAGEINYYLCPVCGTIETEIPDKCSICGVPGTKLIKY